MQDRFQTKFGSVAQLCYQDTDGSWIPVKDSTPLPVQGTSSGIPLNIRLVGDTGEAVDVVLQPDGTYALKVDTELKVNIDNITIPNISVGTDGTSDTKLKTTEAGNLDITSSDLYGMFTDMLKELKKINLQLAFVTDNIVQNADIEV